MRFINNGPNITIIFHSWFTWLPSYRSAWILSWLYLAVCFFSVLAIFFDLTVLLVSWLPFWLIWLVVFLASWLPSSPASYISLAAWGRYPIDLYCGWLNRYCKNMCQNVHCYKALEATRDTLLVEASPYNTLWGDNLMRLGVDTPLTCSVWHNRYCKNSV